MCGRFSLFLALKIIEERFKAKGTGARPSYNIAPTQNATVIFDSEPDVLSAARWGLIPHWAKKENTVYSMINARVETLEEKPTFKKLLETKRCIVPADGFYEWKKTPKGKQPYRIQYAKGVFAFAGLWEEWKPEKGEAVKSFTIITTRPNKTMAEIHDRMPVMLDPSQKQKWLEKGDKKLLEPIPDNLIEAFPISEEVNNPRNNNVEVTRPLTQLN